MNFYLRWMGTTFFGLITNRPYCAEWDRKLSRLIDLHGEKAHVGLYTMTLGKHEVWIANEFYAYGHLYDSSLPEKRPRVRTMRRLDQIVQRHARAREIANERNYVARVRRLEE